MGCDNHPTPEDIRNMEQSRNTEPPKEVTHHIIPAYRPSPGGDNRADYREFFKELGVDVEDWLTDVPAEQHQHDIHGAGHYLDHWDTWIHDHLETADADDVYEKAAQMMEEFVIPIEAHGDR